MCGCPRQARHARSESGASADGAAEAAGTRLEGHPLAALGGIWRGPHRAHRRRRDLLSAAGALPCPCRLRRDLRLCRRPADDRRPHRLPWRRAAHRRRRADQHAAEGARIAGRGGAQLRFHLRPALRLWSANSGIKTLFEALNVAYDETEKRSFVRLNLVSLLFTLGAILIGILFIVERRDRAGGAGLGRPRSVAETLISLPRWPVLFIAAVAAISILYRYGPSRERAKWRWVDLGQRARHGRLAARLDPVLLVPRRISPTTTPPTARSAR